MKRILVLFVTLLFLFSVSVNAEDWTTTKIRDVIKDSNQMNQLKEQINSVASQIPQHIFNFVGDNQVYHVRIGSSSLGLTIKNKQITSITTSRPNSPTHFADTTYSVLAEIANADNPMEQTLYAFILGKIRISEAPSCSNDNQCNDNEVCASEGCKSAFTLVMVPMGYANNEMSKFMADAEPEVDLFKQYAPLKNDRVRVHYVDPKVCPNAQCDDVCRDCQNTASSCAVTAGLAGVTDKVAGVSKGDVRVDLGGNNWLLLCGCAGGIPSFTSVSRSRLYVQNGVYCYNTVPHEVGHQLGLYHIDATGEEAGSCLGPNAADCNEANKKSDIMGYDWPQDHFGPAATNYLKSQYSAFAR